MKSFLNFTTIASILNLASAFLISLACVILKKEYFLIIINYTILSQYFAVFLDTFLIVKLESILSFKDKNHSRIINNFRKNYASFFIFPITIDLLLLSLNFFPFLTVIFSRHFFNCCRSGFPHLKIFTSFTYKTNFLATFRNLTIAICIFFQSENSSLSLSFFIISLLETIILFRLLKTPITFFIPQLSLINIFINKIKTIKSDPRIHYGISSSLMGSIDRFLIASIDPIIQQVFLKLKVLNQYIDAFFGIFGYQTHIHIMREKKIFLKKEYLILFLLMILVGMVSFLVLFQLNSDFSLIQFFPLLTIICIKRITEGLYGSFLLSRKNYYLMIKKNILESLLVGSSFFVIFFTKNPYVLFVTTNIAALLALVIYIPIKKVFK